MLKQARLRITGDVIGVGFRAWSKIQNKNIHAKGWIRNVYHEPEIYGPNGGVEVLLQGSQKQVEDMIAMLKQGPSVARVDDVEILWEKPDKYFDSFEIIK